jgi:hypothetical protein
MMKNERIWSYVKETTPYLQNKEKGGMYLVSATPTKLLIDFI